MAAFKKTLPYAWRKSARTLPPGTPVEVSFQDEMRVGQKNKLTYRWARKGSRPRPFTINVPNQPMCSARYAPSAEPALHSCCPLATPRPCSSISTKSQRKSPPAHTPFSFSIKPDGTAQRPQGSQKHLPPAAAAACAGAESPRKYLAVHACELAVGPYLQILRRHRRPLLLRLEYAHRSAVENHLHRQPRLGSRRSLIVRAGISAFSHGHHRSSMPSRSQLADCIGLRRQNSKFVAEPAHIKQPLDFAGHSTKRELGVPIGCGPFGD